MTRDEAIHALRMIEPEARAMGVTGLYLYGSTARDEAGPDSDLDVFIDYDRERLRGWDIIGVKHLLDERLPVACDVNTRRGLARLMPYGVADDMVRIF